MASITLTVIGCIDYLAYGTIFTRQCFVRKKYLMFFTRQKSPRCALGGGGQATGQTMMTAMAKFGTMGCHTSACKDRGPMATTLADKQKPTRDRSGRMEYGGQWSAQDLDRGVQIANNKEEGLLVMMISTIRLDGLSQPCSFVRWMGTYLADRVDIWGDLQVGAREMCQGDCCPFIMV